MNKVSNGAIGRIIRTLGYLLVLAGSFLLLIEAIEILDISFINEYILITKDFIQDNFGTFFVEMKYIFLASGLLLLINTLNNSIFIRVILSLSLLFVVVNVDINGASYFTHLTNNILPFKITSTGLEEFFSNIINKNDVVTITMVLLVPFLIYALIASKKPNRIATNLVSASMMLLTLSILFHILTYTSKAPFFETAFYLIMTDYVLAITYLVAAIGSAFGIIGIFRK